MGIWDKSNEKMVMENLWYYSEGMQNSYSPKQEEVNSGKLDGSKKITKDKYENFTPKTFIKNKFKREVSFVVDWQLSESL